VLNNLASTSNTQVVPAPREVSVVEERGSKENSNRERNGAITFITRREKAKVCASESLEKGASQKEVAKQMDIFLSSYIQVDGYNI